MGGPLSRAGPSLRLGGGPPPLQTAVKPRRTHETAAAALAFVASRIEPGPVTTQSWTYHDAHGNPVMAVGRFNSGDGSKTYRPVHRLPDGSWAMGDPPGLLPLYRLGEVAQADGVVVLEGEKCADAAAMTGWVTTTSAHGAASPQKTDWTPLAGKKVIIIPDNDPAGEGYALAVMRLLKRLDPRPRVKLVRLPGLARSEDFVEWSARVVGDASADQAAEVLRLELKQLCGAVQPVDLDAIEDDAPPALRIFSGTCEGEPRVPTPLWPDPPEEAAFHGIAGEIVRLITPSTEADPLAYCSSCSRGWAMPWVAASGSRSMGIRTTPTNSSVAWATRPGPERERRGSGCGRSSP